MEISFICHRCKRYTNNIMSMGKWECSFHPGGEEFVTINGREICRFSCCHKRVRDLKYNDIAMLMGQQEHCVIRPKGCTPCDCGNDLDAVHIDDLADFVQDMDHSQWRGFDSNTMILHRNEQSFKAARAGTQHA